MNEPELIERVLAGDPAAERAQYDAHVDRVYRLAYRMAGDDDLAQDFTQDVFIRAFERLRGFRGEAALSTWLHSITVSVTLNGLRKVTRLRRREVDIEALADVGRDCRQPEPELKERLQRAVDALPETQRLVFVMHELEGYTHEEIGAALDVPAGTSKARLSRARDRLREALAVFAEEYIA